MKVLIKKKIEDIKYVFWGLKKLVGGDIFCPNCGGQKFRLIDKKFIFSLLECENCNVLYRHPIDSSDELKDFYQDGYDPGGLTTNLPNLKELSELKQKGFKDTSKDFSSLILSFKALHIPLEARVLDFGANWGYLTYQLNNAGYNAVAFELSESRAIFGKHLGIDIYTSLDQIKGRFDVVYSSHVLEHIPTLNETIEKQMELLNPNGFLIAQDRKSTRLNSSHIPLSRMPSSA